MRTVNAERDRLRQLTAALRQNLELCARDATVDAVHDIRTGTRRIEAMLDTILRERAAQATGVESEGVTELQRAAQRWLRLLKKIRRTAASVRDLDVHRKLLQKLVPHKRDAKTTSIPRALIPETSAENAPGGSDSARLASADANAVPQAADPIDQQAGDLDAWLKHARQHHAQPLMKAALKWTPRLEAQLAALEEAIGQGRLRRRTQRSAALTALEAFARLSSQMQQLDAGNLHDFRKGAKKARYMAESGGDDPQAGAVGKALKRLQDEIGDWHDWLVLAEEAHAALGEHGAELTALVEEQRDRHYALSMNITERMRGRLMGELQALTPRRRVRRAPRESSEAGSSNSAA
jgi:CHAD domain-containing protein